MRQDYPPATTRPILLAQIHDVLKNRQHVEIDGSTINVRKLLDELITFDRGKAIISSPHEEDYTIQVVQNIAFPTSDKMTVENVMRQVLQEFGWPQVSNLGFIQFYFGKMLKELLHDRIVPVFLFEHPEVMRQKAFQLLDILSEYTIDRKPVGIPCIICMTERSKMQPSPLRFSSFHVELHGEVTRNEIIGLIEEICPGYSSVFNADVIDDLTHCISKAMIRAKAKELVSHMKKLGLEKITTELWDQLTAERISKTEYAKAKA